MHIILRRQEFVTEYLLCHILLDDMQFNAACNMVIPNLMHACSLVSNQSELRRACRRALEWG